MCIDGDNETLKMMLSREESTREEIGKWLCAIVSTEYLHIIST